MTTKILRGTFLGIVLGLVAGVLISYGIYYYNRGSAVGADNVIEQTAMSVFGGEESIIPDPAKGGGQLNLNPPECNDLEDVILRFHVKANSNSDEDLALKYTVRDAVLVEIGGKLKGNLTRDDVLSYLKDNLDDIRDIAMKTIWEEGYDYDVNVYIANDFFPVRQYGELVLPAGNYQALRIDIGVAKGENFWCILYPMMCYTVDSGAVVSKNDEKKLERELSSEEYKKLFIDKDTGDNEVKVKFKLLDWLFE